MYHLHGHNTTVLVAAVFGTLAQVPDDTPSIDLELTLVAKVSGSDNGLQLVDVGDMVATEGGGLFVMDAATETLYLLEDGFGHATEIAGRGVGPGRFARAGGGMWIANGRLSVGDIGQGLVHTFTVAGQFIESRGFPSFGTNTVDLAVNMRGDNAIGITAPSFVWDPVRGKQDIVGQIRIMNPDTIAVVSEFKTITPIYFDKSRGVPWGPALTVIANSADWDTMGDSILVVADGLTGLVNWYRMAPGRIDLYQQVQADVAGVVLSSANRRAIAARERRLFGMVVPRTAEWWFPDEISGIKRMIIDSLGYLWLERQVINTDESDSRKTWRVVTDNGEAWVDVVFSGPFEPKSIGDRMVYGTTRDELDVPVVEVYAMDRAQLESAMRPVRVPQAPLRE